MCTVFHYFVYVFHIIKFVFFVFFVTTGFLLVNNDINLQVTVVLRFQLPYQLR